MRPSELTDQEIKDEQMLDALLDVTQKPNDILKYIQYLYDKNKEIIARRNDVAKSIKQISENKTIENWRVKK